MDQAACGVLAEDWAEGLAGFSEEAAGAWMSPGWLRNARDHDVRGLSPKNDELGNKGVVVVVARVP